MGPLRDDLEAARARIESLERELRDAREGARKEERRVVAERQRELRMLRALVDDPQSARELASLSKMVGEMTPLTASLWVLALFSAIFVVLLLWFR